MTIDPKEIAEAELAQAVVPTPDDLLGDVGPTTQLFYLERTAYTVLGNWAAMLSGDEAADLGEADELTRAMNALAEVCGLLDGACVMVGLLPDEALPPNVTGSLEQSP